MYRLWKHTTNSMQNCIPILSFLPQSANGTSYHNQQEMPNHLKYSKPNFKLKNTSQRSTTIPEHESTKYFIAACVLGAAHLIMTFIEKTSSIPLYAHVVMYLRNLPCPITVNNLLYWDDRLRPDINAQIVMSLHNYITSTKRFGS